jgi:hypothetical protein
VLNETTVNQPVIPIYSSALILQPSAVAFFEPKLSEYNHRWSGLQKKT